MVLSTERKIISEQAKKGQYHN